MKKYLFGFLKFNTFIDRIYRITWIFVPFREKGTNRIVLRIDTLISAKADGGCSGSSGA